MPSVKYGQSPDNHPRLTQEIPNSYLRQVFSLGAQECFEEVVVSVVDGHINLSAEGQCTCGVHEQEVAVGAYECQVSRR